MRDFRIEHLQIADLKPNPRNARLHSKKQLHQIAASIREFGFNSIVVIDEDGVILVGHGRVEAAKLAGLTTLPVLRVTHLTDEQKVGFSLVDNKIALNADWDLEQVKLLFRELSIVELNFDMEVTGFETAEIDLLIDGPTVSTKADRSDLVPDCQSQAVSRLGDLWHLGNHKLICADACDKAACSRRGDIVLDAFSGSGTTIIAAHKCRRRARAVELDPLYVDVAVRRWQTYTGEAATMAITGETFAEIEEQRGDPLQ